MDDRTANGVVLSGGGAHAAYGVGVMKALFDGLSPATGGRPLQAEVFAGTSAGAYNATFLATAAQSEAASRATELEQLWLHRIASSRSRTRNGVFRLRANPLEMLDPFAFAREPGRRIAELFEDAGVFTRRALQAGVNFMRSREPLYHRVLDEIDLGLFFSLEPFKELLTETLDLEALRAAGNKLRIVTVCWGGGLHVFEEHHLWGGMGIRPLMASAALPGLSPPVEIDGKLFIDGGVLENAPVWEAYRAGADVIYLVDSYPCLERSDEFDKSSQLHTIYRTMAARWLADLERALGRGQVLNKMLDERAGDPEELWRQIHRLIDPDDPDQSRREPITIHRFSPSEQLRALGWLDFEHNDVARSIDCGIRDAMAHDCQAVGCILPHSHRRRRQQRTVGTGA